MSSGNVDLLQMLRPEETNPTSSRQPKLSYTRQFLLSLSDSENCKRLPEGFDESFLSEFGSSPQQGFRRNEYRSSSPPGKGETGNFSRGLNRWESRASGRSDTDSQSDRDSDSGRRYGNQFKRSWQNPEHDGLLGSGSFPRPPEYRTGASLQSFRGNDQHQLNRSSDPYQPPRPYKAGPPLRRDKDSYNDETFGSLESTSEDRVEEERKRRAEFEMMRKEQHKELQEKMKSKAMDKLKDDPITELVGSLDSEGDAVIANGLDTSLMKPKQNDLGKSSISSQGHPRPLVPPGFANAAVEKISGSKSLEHSGLLEVGKLEHGHGNNDDKTAPKLGMDDNLFETTSPLASKGTKGNLSSTFQLSSKAADTVDLSCRAPNTSELSEILQITNMGIVSENFSGHKIMGETGRSSSILEKLFGGELSLNSSGPPDIVEHQNTKTDDVWSPKGLQTSKFAHLFLEEEKKSPENGSVANSNDLLSLIVGQKGGLIASETKPIQQILPLESNLLKMDTPVPNDAGIPEVVCNNHKKSETLSAFLTCEDLEQSILSNVGESSAHSQPSGIICSDYGMESDIPKVDIDKNASHHLLSLLQKGISSNSNTTPPISMLDKTFPTECQDLNGDKISDIQGTGDGSAQSLSLGKGLTLETLFGTAFMKELHSADAPVSVQRNSAVLSNTDVSEPSMPPLVVLDEGALISSVSDARVKMVNEDDNIFHLGGGYQTNFDEKVGLNWLNVDRSQTGMESSNSPSFGMRLPEEDGLTSFGVHGKARSSMYTNAEMLSSSSNPPVNIAEKLAALGVSVRDERPVAHRQDNSPFFRGPFDMVKPEIPHPSMHAQPSPQFSPAHVNHGKPIFHPLDPHASHIDPQFNFIPPVGVTHQDVSIHHQFPANLGHAPYRHPSTGLSEFDHPIHPILQQMHMPNNRPPSHLLPGFPGGGTHPPHSGGNRPGYAQEHNIIRGFPFGQQQPNHGGIGMTIPGPEHGDMNNSPPQVLQRQLEMELRSSKKPMHHPSFAAGSAHSRPMYGHELDAGFWYR